MKSSIKKLFAMCAAVSAITAVTAMSASAAGEITAKPSDDGTSVTVRLGSGDVSGETTILLLKGDYTAGTNATVSDEDIFYINQDDAGTAKATGGFLADDGVLPKETLVENQVYTVKVADESGAFIYQTTFTLGAEPEVVYGDINGDGRVNTADANLTLRYATHEAGLVFTETQQKAADVNIDTRINTADANYILRYATHEAGLTLPVTK